MSLAEGTRLGPYEILAPLGAGGMGEVYRARDTRLHRDVAIKILPVAFASDPERLARFEREAHVLAALNHPHIAQIYGLEAAPDERGTGARALVMELVDGRTLSEKLSLSATGSALPIDEALEIGRQVAEALDAAHERGIVHRDLKPANIKVRDDGTVKVLDFGLANWAAGADRATAIDQLNSPTITSPAMTARGTILGTAAYMAPEQAKGRPVDKRADIWAFGCVLFEMLSGRRAFGGDSVTETLASVIKDAPRWDDVPASTPAPIRRVLHRCLEKDPRRRLHDIADARLEIDDVIESIRQGGTGAVETARPQTVSTGMRRREMGAWATAGALAIVAAAAGTASFIDRGAAQPATPRPTRVSLLHRGTVIKGPPEISPDGQRVVYVARNPNGMWSLWVRELDAAEPRQLADTEEFDEFSHHPFWSPDSRSIGFFGSGGLHRIAASGGGRQHLGNIGFARGGAWSSSGVILFAPEDNLGLVSIPENGGPRTTVTTLPKEGAWEHSWPSFLPDGRRFLFTARPLNRPFETSNAGIYLGSLDAPEIQRLLPDTSSAVYSTLGYILFRREGVLTAAPFDAATGHITGDVTSLGDQVTTNSFSHRAAVSVSGNNVIALRNPGAFEDLGQLQWIDRRGVATNVAPVQTYFFDAMAVSPEGRRIAATISDVKTGSADIWMIDETGNLRRLTTSREWEGWPIWSPDGKRIAYSSSIGNGGGLMVQDVDGGEPVIIHEWREGVLLPRSWSVDGHHLMVNRVAIPGRAPDIFVWSFESKTLTPFLDSSASEFLGMFSPDGRFVTYLSDEAGPLESWVASFPTPTVKRRVATLAGPISWRGDGREILLLGSAREVSAVPITIAGEQVVVGTPAVLIKGFPSGLMAGASRDHSRLLRLVRPDPEEGVAEIRLLTGWAGKLP